MDDSLAFTTTTANQKTPSLSYAITTSTEDDTSSTLPAVRTNAVAGKNDVFLFAMTPELHKTARSRYIPSVPLIAHMDCPIWRFISST
nr:wsv324-like protein [Chionoecetes opilio bacilliform virus]